jgi:anti-anti-sigma factor
MGEPMGIAAQPFSITEIHVPGYVGLAVTGEIDESTCGELDSALAMLSDGGSVVLDLGACTSIDSKGLDVIMRGATRLLEDGRQLIVQNARGPVRELFRMSRATDWPGLVLQRRDVPA